MHITKRLGLGATAAAVGLGLVLTGAGAASADPIGTPADRALRGVGSDTTQYLYNGLSQVLLTGAGQKFISSYDAVPQPSTIVTHTGGATFHRPDGSGDGMNALRASIAGTAYNNGAGGTVALSRADVNFARSSNTQSWGTGTTLTHITTGVDALTWATKSGSLLPTTIPVGNVGDPTTTLTLRNIYAGNVTSYTPAGGSPIALHPLLPQAGSGTRNFFVNTVLAGTTIGTGVVDSVGGVPVQENSDDALIADGYLMPFSVGSWVAQTNFAALNSNYGTSVVDNRANAELRRTSAGVAPVAGGQTNPANPIKRPLFTVVATDSLNSADPDYLPQLAATFQTGGSAYSATSPFSGRPVTADFGFLSGSVTVDPDGSSATDNSITYTVGSITASQSSASPVTIALTTS